MTTMRRKNKQSKQIQKMRIGIIVSCAVLGILGMIGCNYGHAAVSTDLLISGKALYDAPPTFKSTYMQDVTVAECKSVEVEQSKQLIDKRDGKKYWVTKMADGNCWMTQNLALDLSATKPLTSTLTALTTSFTAKFDTQTTITTAMMGAGVNGQRSWSFNDYFLKDPTNTTTGCAAGKTSPASCPDWAISTTGRTASSDPYFYEKNKNRSYNSKEYDAHYLIGNLYLWCAATAGTCEDTTTANYQASASICPKGWILPRYNDAVAATGVAGSYRNLIRKYLETHGSIQIDGPPFYLARAGHISSKASEMFIYIGGVSYNWTSSVATTIDSSTGKANTNNAYAFILSGTGTSTSGFSRTRAVSVRCLVLANTNT